MRTWALCPSGTDPTPPALGGRLCLAFVNSVLWRRSRAPIDLIGDYPALADYLLRVGLLDDAERDRLTAAAAARPAKARGVHAEAIALRESLFRLLSTVAAGAAPAEEDLRNLNGTLQDGLATLRLAAPDGGGLTAGWPETGRLEWPLWEVAASTSALLLGPDLVRLKQCPGEACGWLFVDRSRNLSRRWCASTMCGNRDRARRHYHRTHGHVS
ncbi:MAG TPA: ABATE domain-containing protein [Actinophytocola sp.]|uniref:CGNR zinc finger domain-containing protein n=1 Tax=Actinophytocola sp. TaxID=1872138 RepID=UPI002DDCA43F|nr:ABATE domain-containing protein [Actinophytocola sp.]HEV2779267.1 ABATE domain-containing protein [Actinophytocola sp.]